MSIGGTTPPPDSQYPHCYQVLGDKLPAWGGGESRSAPLDVAQSRELGRIPSFEGT